MEARPSQLLEFFDGTKQMLVPLFQRPYEWERKEWETLWADVLEQYENVGESSAAPSHFTGAIVTAPAKSVPVGVSKYLVIDGQQRLTTLSVLICALRSRLQESSKSWRKLGRLLVNEDEDGADYYKLMPTQPDRSAYKALVAGTPPPSSRFERAFRFFCERIAGCDPGGDAIDPERLTTVIQTKLTVVAIHLGDTDDPYLLSDPLVPKVMGWAEL